MSIFILPSKITAAIDKSCRDFLWGVSGNRNKLHRVSWDKVCLSKNLGGVGFREGEKWNKALLAKYLWALASKADCLWVKWINSIYLKDYDIWNCPKKVDANWYFKKILNLRDNMNEMNLNQAVRGNKFSGKGCYNLFVEGIKVTVAINTWLGDFHWPRSTAELLYNCCNMDTGLVFRIWNAVLAATLYFLWKNRNTCIYELCCATPSSLSLEIRKIVQLRILSKGPFKDCKRNNFFLQFSFIGLTVTVYSGFSFIFCIIFCWFAFIFIYLVMAFRNPFPSNNISLTDIEREVNDLPTSVQLNNQIQDVHTLLARVISSREINRKTFRIKMSGHWKGRYPVTITDHHSGLFSVSFGCEGDKRMALIMEPWHFQNHHIVLREPCALQEVTEDSLHQSPFWVQLHRLPTLSKSKAMAKWAGNIVGTYLDVDEDSLHEGWGPYLRFQALLDLSKPLLRGKMARIRDSREEFWVEFRYERLPEFCFECGIIGHPFEHCPTFLDQIYNGQEPTLEYGPEMMGAPLPSSGYDRYRTDFFKGNAWPLMTRLAKKSFAAVLPRINDRPNPHSYKLTVTESSSPSPTNLSHQSSHVTHVSSSQITPHDPSIIPFPSYLPISLPTNIPNSTPSFATYPPHTNLHYSSSPIINSTSLKQKGIMTDSTSISIPFSDITNNMPQSTAVPHINGPQYIDDNAPGHNPASKRPIESESLRKFLKRCRSHNNGQSDTPVSTDRSSNRFFRGLGNPTAFRFLRLLISEQAPCVLFLMETKLQSGSVDKFRNSLHFPNGIEVPRHGLGGGLMLLWKLEADVTINNFSSNHIDCFIEFQDLPSFHFTGFYGHPQSSQRIHTWTLLKRCCDIAPNFPWLVMGDFNEVLTQADKIGGPLRNNDQIQAFQRAVDCCHLEAAAFEGELITWSNKSQGQGNVKERLDYGFFNDSWCDFFHKPILQHLDYYHSDHRALKLTVSLAGMQIAEPTYKSRFRFEKIWLQDSECLDIIFKCWSTNGSDPIPQTLNNIQSCASQLHSWHHHKFGHMKKKIKTAHKHVEVLQNSSSTTQEHFTALQHSEKILDELLAQEEDYWHQRSRVSWLKSGDSNTKFFHQRANARHSNNKIKKLTGDDGQVYTSSHDILSQVENYFADIFTSQGVDQQAIQAVLDTIPELISRESQDVLSSPFTATEVYAALKSMSEDSSPGVDGMSVMFYTTYWHIVGSLVTSSVLDVLNHGGDPSSFNRTLITLIPKVKKPSRITQYRPISLCNVLYKLVSKTIVLRIQPYMAVVISEFQSAFLSQRLITDNILVAFEVLHSLKTRKRGRQGYAAMKLDMSKAFDRVEWFFLEQVMLKLGFGFPMVELILRCLKSVSYSFLLNGSIQGSITPQRGIRQGDPLSPYLFLICSEGFSRLLQFQESIGALQGLKVSRSAPPITHLLFADDSVLFCRASRSSARAIHLCLDLYSRASGQMLNPEKSVLSFSPNTRTTEQHFFQHLLNMPIQPCHEQYLGLPSFSGRDKSQLFSGITDKIWKLMNAWREQLFSIGGKEVLLKAVVQAIPTYAMSCFQLPVKLCNQIEQLMSRFWWGKSANGNAIHWKNWKFLCKSKVHGGMGFRNFVHFNQALLAKQAWRILEDPSSLIARVLKSRYFATGVFLEATAGAQPSLTWKSIVWGKELLLKGLRWRIGSGADVNCVSQPWIPGPSNFKPLLFLSPDRDVKVADFITHSRQWDVPKLQQFFTPPDVDRILSIPLSLFPCEDVLLWHYSSAGFYTVKSGYKLASDVPDSQPNSSHTTETWWQYFWGLKLPSKIRIFAWRAYHEALPTAAILQYRHISSSPQCPLCQVHLETINHAFFWCNRAKQVWKNWDESINWSLSMTCSFSDFLVYVSSQLQAEKVELFLTTLWCIWTARNAETHSKSPKSALQIFQFASSYLAEFRKAQAKTNSAGTRFQVSPATSLNSAAESSAQLSHLVAASDSAHQAFTYDPTGVLPPTKPKWLAPPSGRLKMNTDAAVNVATGVFGLAAILRNSTGDILAAMVKPMKGCVKAEEMEALAIAWGLKLMLHLRLNVDFIESDSLMVVNGLKSHFKGLSAFHVILNDITFLLSNFPRAQISHVYRSANNEAHLLAKFALTVDSDCTWLEEVPPPLMTVM
uniref:Reverse transcriptase domain-containing protein n=1 Tax=Cannabis sativa TaxID=3483 RepID=A0A803Q6Z2_CANSA